MRPSDIPTVRSLELFRGMEETCFADLVQAAYLQNFPAQLELIGEGDPADFLYVVVEGCVELHAHSGARSATMGIIHPAGTFTLAAVLRDSVSLMAARTLEKSRILLIPSVNVRAAFGADDKFARAIVAELARDYRDMVREHKNIKLRTAVERLANRLLCFYADQGGAGEIRLPYEKRTIASLLGMTPENLSRAFNTLKRYGVEVDGARVRLDDPEALETLARPNRLIDDRAS